MEALPELKRSHDDVVVAGVCSALARHLGIDPLLVRVAAVLLALSSGVGVVLYGFAWLGWEREGGNGTLLDRWYPAAAAWSPQRRRTVLFAATATTALVLLSVTPWSIGPALVLLLMVLLARSGRFGTTSVSPGASSPAIPAAPESSIPDRSNPDADRPQISSPKTSSPDVPSPSTFNPSISNPSAANPSISNPTGSSPAPLPRRKRPRWPGLLVLLVSMLTLTTARLLTDGMRGSVLLACSAALAVVAASLLVTVLARLPHPRLAVPTGLVLMVAMVGGAVLADEPGGDDLDATSTHYSWTSPAQVPDRVQQVRASEVTFDLSAIPAGHDVDLAVDAQVSRVVVLVPRASALSIDVELRASNLTVRDGSGEQVYAGQRQDAVELSGSGADAGEVSLNLRAAASTVEVRRV